MMSCKVCGGDCKRCAICGRFECEHCAFVPLTVPANCNCDTRTWGSDDIPPVCDSYEGNKTEYCLKCEHDYECHAKVE